MTAPDDFGSGSDFFYAMYDMENRTAVMELNPAMPAEAAILETVFTSVTDIVAAEQQARKAEYRLLLESGVEISPEAFYYDSANYELDRVLSRRSVFTDFSLDEDVGGSSVRAACATVLAMLCMFIPLCILRGLSDELSYCIVDRLKCSGKGVRMLVASRYVSSFLILCVPCAAITLLSGNSFPFSGWVAAFLLFTGSFLLFGLLCLSTPDASKAQLIGNCFVMMSLLIGGAFYPYAMLPKIIQDLARFTLPFYLLRGLDGSWSSAGVLAVFSGLLLALFGLLLRIMSRKPEKKTLPGSRPGTDILLASASSSRRPDTLAAVWYKLLAMTGSRFLLLVLVATCTLCFLTVNRVLGGKTAQELNLAVVDEDGTEASARYLAELESSSGLCLQHSSATEAKRLLEQGRVEAILTIGSGFEDSFYAGEKVPVRYLSSSLGATSEAGREICAGVLLSLQSRTDALGRLKEKGVLNEQETTRFDEILKSVRAEARPILKIVRSGIREEAEKNVYSRIYARYSGFCSMLIFLFVMSLSVLLSGEASRTVRKTFRTLPHGYAAAVFTDYGALLLAGILLSAAALLCRGTSPMREWIAYFFFTAFTASLCMLLSLTRAGGGADTIAAFFALITGTLGGSFFDLASLGKGFRFLSYLTPQGLLIGAVSGSAACLAALAAAACICFTGYYLLCRRKT